jgi:hypothetical protein
MSATQCQCSLSYLFALIQAVLAGSRHALVVPLVNSVTNLGKVFRVGDLVATELTKQSANKCSQFVPFVTQEDAAPRLECFVL